MSELMEQFGIPADLMEYVNDGTLVVANEDEATHTVTFNVPAVDYTDEKGEEFWIELEWIHPDFNAEHCHYYEEEPGDLPNFYLTKRNRDYGDEDIDCEDFDDLICWLEEVRERVVRA